MSQTENRREGKERCESESCLMNEYILNNSELCQNKHEIANVSEESHDDSQDKENEIKGFKE